VARGIAAQQALLFDQPAGKSARGRFDPRSLAEAVAFCSQMTQGSIASETPHRSQTVVNRITDHFDPSSKKSIVK
jgi:hypothetical protein